MADGANAPQGPLQGLTFQSPGTFSFSANDWPAYKRKVQRWFNLSEAKLPEASRLTDKEKRDALIYMMGDDQADEIVATFQGSIDDTTTFAQFLTLFDNYFTPRANTVAERAKFFDRRQGPCSV